MKLQRWGTVIDPDMSPTQFPMVPIKKGLWVKADEAEKELYAKDASLEIITKHNDELLTQIKELEESLELARNYKGIEARPCPLCEYKNGKFIKSCSMHSRIKELEAENKSYHAKANEYAKECDELEEEQSERAADHMNLVEENHRLREQLAKAEEFVKHVSFDSCQCCLKYGLKYPSEHLRDCIVGKAQDYFKGK